MTTSRLLFPQFPLVVSPPLARKIGLNEAIVLQQVHYWVTQNEKAKRNQHDGYFWTFNSYDSWLEEFPFWSLATIRRAVKSLEDLGLLVSGTFNRRASDRTKWYRVDHDRLALLDESESTPAPAPKTPPGPSQEAISVDRGVSKPSVQNEHMGRSNRAPGLLKMSKALPETTTETTTKTTKEDSSGRIFRLYEANIGKLTTITADLINDTLKTYPADWIEQAITIAVKANKRSWRYVEGVLERMGAEGIDVKPEELTDDQRKVMAGAGIVSQAVLDRENYHWLVKQVAREKERQGIEVGDCYIIGDEIKKLIGQGLHFKDVLEHYGIDQKEAVDV